ncbi:MAG: M23 family metallopeptidase [Lentimicrobiaceae bacterium]|jgi:murein DD-endopeptidase MepM/ murein hydrolase activator NlpD|nr:M23 family metallopeptidase [Lentimicrobiaceae bacterium]
MDKQPEKPIKKKRTLREKLSNKYRLVLFHDETFEEKITFRLSLLNVFVFLITLCFLLVIITAYIIAFTPLREYIPGYTDVSLNRDIYQLQRRADSLEHVFEQKNTYIANINRILNGYDFAEDTLLAYDSENRLPMNFDTIELHKSASDSLLRAEFEAESGYNLYYQGSLTSETHRRAMEIKNFYVPLKGMITNHFNPETNHFGIDVISNVNEAIKSVLDGTVVFADWTVNKGYVIGIQHEGNIFSIYKHNATLMKKEGDRVLAGEIISIIGESGELSSGPHLHFELWFNGVPVDPTSLVAFE